MYDILSFFVSSLSLCGLVAYIIYSYRQKTQTLIKSLQTENDNLREEVSALKREIGDLWLHWMKNGNGKDVGQATSTFGRAAVALRLIDEYVSLDELRTMCMYAGIKYDNLPGEGMRGKAASFVERMQTTGRTRELLDICRTVRKDLPWPA